MTGRRQTIINKLSILLLFLIFVFPLSSREAEKETFEVVATIPVETTLGKAGTENPADTWVKMIEGAKKTIDLGHFYMETKENEPLERVIQALIDAAGRGVRVRILVGTAVNASMAENTNAVLSRFKDRQNIEITSFNWKELTGGIIHAKYMIVDSCDVYIGSQNFDWRALKHIHETGLHIKSIAFGTALSQIFEADREYNRGDKTAYQKLPKYPWVSFKNGNFLVGSPDEYNPPSVKSAIKTLVDLIDHAKKKITIQLLDYSTDIPRSEEKFTAIDNALRRAAARGVQVRLLVSDWNKDKPEVESIQALAKLKNFEVKFATIPEFSGGYIPYARVIHSKVMRIDDTISWVGTSNWGYGYFYKSRDVEVVTHIKEVARVLDQLFNELWKSSYTYFVDPAKEYTPPKHN